MSMVRFTKKMDFDYLEGTIIDQIEILAEELDGTVRHSTKCNSMGRQSKVIEIEYRVETKE